MNLKKEFLKISWNQPDIHHCVNLVQHEPTSYSNHQNHQKMWYFGLEQGLRVLLCFQMSEIFILMCLNYLSFAFCPNKGPKIYKLKNNIFMAITTLRMNHNFNRLRPY